jgi:predicted nucleic acid-binding protein
VTLLDAYALIAFLVGGPATAQVRALLREGDAAVATANLAEALDVSQRLFGLPVARAVEALEPLLEEALRPVVLDLAVAQRAATIRATHYHRATRPISLADAILIASAVRSSGEPGRRRVRLATSDPDVLAVARAEGVATVELPAQR